MHLRVVEEMNAGTEWKWPESTIIDGYEFRGGGVCPEQYDVFKDGVQLAYLRLRHGSFTVECPSVGGSLAFHAYPNGDGSFMDDERGTFLRMAIGAIQAHMSIYSA